LRWVSKPFKGSENSTHFVTQQFQGTFVSYCSYLMLTACGSCRRRITSLTVNDPHSKTLQDSKKICVKPSLHAPISSSEVLVGIFWLAGKEPRLRKSESEGNQSLTTTRFLNFKRLGDIRRGNRCM